MNCWKCGKPCEGVECVRCGDLPAELTSLPSGSKQIDWSRIKSFQDLLQVLSIIQITVSPASPAYEKLKPWLKDL